MKRPKFDISAAAAQGLEVWVIDGGRTKLTTLYNHVMKSSPGLHYEYEAVRDIYFLFDRTRNTDYWLTKEQAEDVLLIA